MLIYTYTKILLNQLDLLIISSGFGSSSFESSSEAYANSFSNKWGNFYPKSDINL